MTEKLENEEVIVDEESIETEVTDVDTDEEVETVEETVEEITYTQADVDLLNAQIEELSKYKPNEPTEDEVKIQEKLANIWTREVNATLKDEGLEIFTDFIRVDVDDTETLNSQINKLKEIVGTLELSSGYQPTNHKSADGYSLAKKNKDVNGMIKNKLKF